MRKRISVNSVPSLLLLLGFMLLPLRSWSALRQTKPPSDGQSFQQYADKAAQARREGQLAEAIRLYLKALQLQPKWAKGWREVGMLLADYRDFQRAEAAFRNLLAIEPQNGGAWALLGLCEYQQGRYDEAYKHIEHGRALGVGNADLDNVAAYHSALIMIGKGEFEVAHYLLVHVARGGATDPDLVTAFGLAALRVRVADPGKIDPQQKDLITRVGQIEFQAVHAGVPEVTAAYQELIQKSPTTRGLHYALGNFLITSGVYAQGLEEMQKELLLNPTDPMAVLQIAMTDLKTGQLQQGLPYAEKAVQFAPKLFVAHYALGWILYKLGENARALPELERTVKLAPDSAQGHYALSQAYIRAHRKDDAEREREFFARLKQQELEQTPTPANSSASPPGDPRASSSH
jgi:tetratricopeptide (TPR) repeat protein